MDTTRTKYLNIALTYQRASAEGDLEQVYYVDSRKHSGNHGLQNDCSYSIIYNNYKCNFLHCKDIMLTTLVISCDKKGNKELLLSPST